METIKELSNQREVARKPGFGMWVNPRRVGLALSCLFLVHVAWPRKLKKREHENDKHKQAMGKDWLCAHWSMLVQAAGCTHSLRYGRQPALLASLGQ